MPLTQTKPGFVPFLSFPTVTLPGALKADVAIFGAPYGVPYDVGGPFTASALAPAAIRLEACNTSEGLDHYDFDLEGPLFAGKTVSVVDCGDVVSDGNNVPGTCKRITETARTILGAGAVPFMLGGDDSVPIPFFRAFEGRGDFTIVQIDSHIDWRDEVRGVREGYSSTMRRASEMPWIKGMVQIGQRGVGSARIKEVEEARAYGSKIIPARQVHRQGIDWVLSQIPGDRPFIVTIDCDGVDPSVIPAVNAAVPGGLSFHQVTDLLTGLTKKNRIAGFDIVEMAPVHDLNNLSANAVGRILLNLLGRMVRSGQIGK